MIKKLSIRQLKRLCKTPCKIMLYTEGLSENGSPLIYDTIPDLKCRFVEKAKTIIDSEGKKVQLIGKVILVGDIAPELKKVSGGEVIINDTKYDIYLGSRPRNPDGTVHHTTLELM